MRHPTPATLDGVSPATAFLDLRWNEFYDRFTIDTYRPRFSNLPSVVREILDVSARLGERSDWAYHVVHLQEELKFMLSLAREFKWLTPAELWQLDQLASAKVADAANIAAIICGCDFKSVFESRMMSQLEALPSALPKEKKRADAVLNQLATIALHRELGDVVREGCLKLAPDAWVNGLLDRLAGASVEHEIYILIRSKGSWLGPGNLNILLRNSGFRTVPGPELEALQLPALPNGGAMIVEKVSAPAPQVALSVALRRLEPVIDMLGFHLLWKAPLLPKEGWVRVEGGPMTKVAVESPSYRLVKPSSKIDHLIETGLKPEIKARFEGSVANALDLHTTAMATPEVRTRFLNLWTALECLSSLVGGGSVIEKVANLVCPIVTWRKIEKIGRYCAINLHHWRITSGSKQTPVGILPGEDKDHIPVSAVIRLLCRPREYAGFTELKGIARQHPLLDFRLGSVWERFHNPRDLASALQASRSHLDWHLNRIYRARNLLVHSGKEVSYLEALSDNLHYYLSTVLSRIIHGVSSIGWMPAESARYWIMNADFVIDTLKSSPEKLTLENLVPDRDLLDGDQAPWDHATPVRPVEAIATSAVSPVAEPGTDGSSLMAGGTHNPALS